MSTYSVPKCGRHFVKFDNVTIYPVLVVSIKETRDIADKIKLPIKSEF